MTVRCNLKTVRKPISEKVPFNCNGTLRGEYDYHPSFGWASNTMAGVSLANHLMGSTKNFVVYSYETPIACYSVNKGWWVNPDKYTVTTSRHMSAIKRGING